MSAEMNLGSLTRTRTLNNFVGNFTGGIDTRDTFAFSLSSTQNLNVSLTGMSADANLRLFRARSIGGDLQAIEEVAASTRGGNLDELISQVLDPGIYIAEVSQGNSSASTNYRLQFSPQDAASSFNVGTFSGVEAFSGFVGDSSPSDVYRFSLSTPSNLSLRLTGMSEDADLRLAIDLNHNGLIDNGEEITRSEEFSRADESMSLQSLVAGDYLAEVYRFQTHNTHYRLQLSATATDKPLSRVDLVGQFGTIRVPDIRLTDDVGQAQILVSNQGSLRTGSSPVTVRLYASTDGTLDGNDELLASQTATLSLLPGQSQAYNFSFDAPTGVAPGSYYLLARVDANNAIAETTETNNIAGVHVSAPGTDVVLDWNATLLNAIQAEGTSPPLAARNQAIVQAAIYDAVNAIDRTHTTYQVTVDANYAGGASMVSAAAAAAYRTLSELYPNQQAEFDAQLARSLAAVPDGFSETRGVNIGQFVADQILAVRRFDGSATAQASYTFGTAPGSYQSTYQDGFVLLPNWGQVTPFAVDGSSILDGPPAYGSDDYATQLNQVQALGGRNSVVRTADQTEVALFWASDRPDTFRPPGQWNEIAETASLQAGTSLVDNARLFALLNIAQADAGIAAWNVKFADNQLRPVTAIHQASLDGNPLTVGDPNWQPLLSTPPFPDYVSGHSSFGAAAAEVLTSFYGDNHSFTVSSQEIHGVYRAYDSFRRAAEEDGISRVYGGVHTQIANEDGLINGYSIGRIVTSNLLTRLTSISQSDEPILAALETVPEELLV